jgi:ABC-type sugar transport system ATPase subunit
VLPALKRSGGSCDGQVVMGVRPQDLTIVPREACPIHGLIGTVASVESLGSRTDVSVVDRSGRTWIVTSHGRVTARPQDSVALTLDVLKVHLFEPGPQGRTLDGSG